MQSDTIQKLESILGVKHSPSPHEQGLFSKARKFVRLISWIPGLRMIAVSNSLAMYATHRESDIDIFIITAPKRIWLVRTLVLLTATILRVRAKPGDEAGKFCFPFFITEKHLSLKNIAIENDIYLAYWIRTLKPIYNKDHTYGRFMKMNRSFCEEMLGISSNISKDELSVEKNRDFFKRIKGSFLLKNPLSPLLDYLDHKLGEISMGRIKTRIPSAAADGIRVTENMVKLHYTDRRGEVRERVSSI